MTYSLVNGHSKIKKERREKEAKGDQRFQMHEEKVTK